MGRLHTLSLRRISLLAKLSKQMKHDEFIKHVQSAAQFNSREESMLRYTALKERIVGNEANWQHNCSKNLGSICEGEKRSILSPRRVYSACE